MIDIITPSSGAGQALLRAVTAGRPRQVRLLIESGADVNFVDECFQTPLIRATFLENTRVQTKIVKTLIRSGAKISMVDVVGRNALMWSCLFGRDTIIPVLLNDTELDLNRGDMNGNTALFHATTSGRASTVKMMVEALLKYKLSVDISNLNGVTPLMQAVRLGHDVCASILVHQGGASTTIRDNQFLSATDWGRKEAKSKSETLRLPQIGGKKNTNQAKILRALRRARRHFAHDTDSSGSDEENDSSYDSESPTCNNRTDIADNDIMSDLYSWTEKSNSSRHIPSPTSDFTEEDCDDCSSPVTDITKNLKKSQIREGNDLPFIYDLYGNQLSKSFRPGVMVASRDSPSPDISHGERCKLECCNKIERCRTATIRVSDKHIKKVVASGITTRKDAQETGTSRKLRSKDSDLRRMLAHKRLHQTVTDIPEESNKDTESKKMGSLPSIGQGKVFLVGAHVQKDKEE